MLVPDHERYYNPSTLTIDIYDFDFQWHSLSRDEQAKYYEMARKERQLHMQMYPGKLVRFAPLSYD